MTAGGGLAGQKPRPAARRAPMAVGYGASAVLHAALFALLLRAPAPEERRSEPVTVEIVEVAPPPTPPPAPPEPEPARPQPVRVVRPPKRIASLPPPPRDAPPPPPEAPPDAPPPPNDAPAAKPGPVRIGISMSSTTSTGGYAAPVGNSLYGKAPERATEPGEARPYRSDRYVPPTQVTTLPEVVSGSAPRSEYPPEARKLQREARVRLRVYVDELGRVAQATVIADPGFGFGEAAVRVMKRYYKFRPARRNGEPVATEIPFTVVFELD